MLKYNEEVVYLWITLPSNREEYQRILPSFLVTPSVTLSLIDRLVGLTRSKLYGHYIDLFTMGFIKSNAHYFKIHNNEELKIWISIAAVDIIPTMLC